MCITGSMPEEFQRNIANYLIRKWIKTMNIAVLTWLEGLPISLLEAMYMKKSCVVSNVIGNNENCSGA